MTNASEESMKGRVPDMDHPDDMDSLLEMYKGALDYHSIVAITDVRGTIQYVNDAFCKLSKFGREELIGSDHRIVNSGHHTPEFFRVMWKTIASGKIWSGDVKNKAKDGSYYWVQTSVIPFRNSRGKVFQYVAIRTDITEKIALQEKMAGVNARLKQVTEELQAERNALNGKNLALNELISHIEADKDRLKQTIAANIESIVFPLLETMKVSGNSLDKKYVDLVIQNLKEIAEPFMKSGARLTSQLTPKELQICNMIKNGLSVKEIAQILHLSPRTIDKHRENIRGKLDIKSRKINLASYLLNNLS